MHLYHDSRKARFRSPFGAVTCGTTVRIRMRAVDFVEQASLVANGEVLPMARDAEGVFSAKIRELAETPIRREAWDGSRYLPNRLNYKDRLVALSEEIASEIDQMLAEQGLIRVRSRYLEVHVDAVLADAGRV